MPSSSHMLRVVAFITYSTSDVNASFNIGRVIAQRCHHVGIDSMIFDTDTRGVAVSVIKMF